MRKFVVASAALALAGVSQAAEAAEVLDQSSVPTSPTPSDGFSIFVWGADYIGLAQSFTVGETGTLSRIQVGITNRGSAQSATLTVYDGLPSFGALAPAVYSTSITLPTLVPAPGFFDWTTMPSWDVSAGNIQLTPFRVMTFAITLPSLNANIGVINSWGTWSAGGGVYAGGELFRSREVDVGYSSGSGLFDTPFRTFMSTAEAAVPEPATWAMLIMGFGLVGGAMRVRLRRAAIGAGGWMLSN